MVELEHRAARLPDGRVLRPSACESLVCLDVGVREATDDESFLQEKLTRRPAVRTTSAQLFSAGPMPAGQSVIAHDEGSVVGQGCDDQFEFALDLLLDGFDNLHHQGRKVGPGPDPATDYSRPHG